jgi:hypothetical protein
MVSGGGKGDAKNDLAVNLLFQQQTGPHIDFAVMVVTGNALGIPHLYLRLMAPNIVQRIRQRTLRDQAGNDPRKRRKRRLERKACFIFKHQSLPASTFW